MDSLGALIGFLVVFTVIILGVMIYVLVPPLVRYIAGCCRTPVGDRLVSWMDCREL
jgi:hypothetical protein